MLKKDAPSSRLESTTTPSVGGQEPDAVIRIEEPYSFEFAAFARSFSTASSMAAGPIPPAHL